MFIYLEMSLQFSMNGYCITYISLLVFILLSITLVLLPSPQLSCTTVVTSVEMTAQAVLV